MPAVDMHRTATTIMAKVMAATNTATTITANVIIVTPGTITRITIMATASVITIITTVTPMLMTTNDRGQGGVESEREESAALFRLMTWLSPSFPVGSFSYSSGIEWAVEAGDISDMMTLQQWLAAMLLEGAGFCDGTFLCHAYRAAYALDGPTLNDVAELAAAFTPSRERHLETTAQGRAFVEIARSAWNCEALGLLSSHVAGPVAYPVAVGVLAAGHRIPLTLTLHAFLHATTSNWISAGVRLIPLGQTDSQRALAALESAIAATAEKSFDASLDDLASATFRADLASMRHEAQYTRLFRS
jgi:urease accessory protein